MKIIIFYTILSLWFTEVIKAQVLTGTFVPNENTDKNLILKKIQILEQALNFKESNKLTEIAFNEVKSNKQKMISLKDGENINIKTKDIYINGNSAIVNITCKLFGYSEITDEIDDTLKLEKDREWKFKDLGNFDKKLNKSNESMTVLAGAYSSSFNKVVFNYSDKTLIPYRMTANGQVYEINSNLTQQYLSTPLFANGTEIDCAVYGNSIDQYGNGNWALFTVDPIWERIIFSNNSSNTVKSYGDHHPGDVEFFIPVAIDVNEYGEVFVLDAYTRKVTKLIYSYTNNSLQADQAFNINSDLLFDPTDLDYSSYTTNGNKNDDFILVSDRGRCNGSTEN